MRHGQGAKPLFLTVLAAPLMLGAAPPEAPSANRGSVVVEVDNVRNARGLVRACLTSDADDFPVCTEERDRHADTPAAPGKVMLRFNGVPQGRYAIAILHDENANGKIDKAMGMMPREGFGFSRDAPLRMGPPRFGDAAFAVEPGDTRLRVKMRYLL